MSIGWSATTNSNFNHRCSRNPWTGAQEDYSSSCNSAHGVPMLHSVNTQRIPMQHTNDYQEDITGGSIRIPSGYVPSQMPARHPQRMLHSGPSVSGYTSHTPSDRPITPISISTADGVVDPWGGRCRTFEKCCNYFLKVIFTLGILCGISLVMVGYILNGQRGGEDATDNTVYVYIGALLGMVCILLLSIQCNAQRERSRKKKFRRSRIRLESRVRDLRNSTIPFRSENRALMGELRENDGIQLTEMHSYSEAGDQYTPNDDDDDAGSENGTPWWRRERDATYKYVDYPMGHLPYSNKTPRYLP